MDKKRKVGCIGLGPRGRYLFSVLLANPNVEAYAVCDQNQAALEECRNVLEGEKKITGVKYFTSYQELLQSDVEAVIVATHVSTHCDIAVECLYAGKHVLCEIPNITSIDEAKKLNRAVKANPKQKFMVAENCCFWAFVDTWKKMYDDGLLGDIIYAESDYLHAHKEIVPNGEMTWRSYLPSITYLTHNLGPLLYIMGDTCAEISGFVPDINPIAEQHPAPPDGLAIIKTRKGALIKIYTGFGVYHQHGHGFAVYGSKGSLETQVYKGFKNQNTLAHLESIANTHEAIEVPVNTAFPNASQEGHGGADLKMMDAFVDCIIKDEKPPLDIEFGINIALPGIFADLSSKHSGKVFRMPDISEFDS